MVRFSRLDNSQTLETSILWAIAISIGLERQFLVLEVGYDAVVTGFGEEPRG